MNKNLLQQIWNERRINLSLVIELMLASIVLWYIVDTMLVYQRAYNQSPGFDTDNCYAISYRELMPANKGYLADAVSKKDAFSVLLKRLEHHPAVEAVCLSSFGIPYRGGQASNNFFCSADSSFQGIPLLFTQVTPGFFSVFRIQGTNNETGETLSHAFAQLASDEMFASDNVITLGQEKGKDKQAYMNASFSYDPLFENGVRKLHGFVNPIKLAHYNKDHAAQLFYQFTNYGVGADLTVRLKDGLSKDQINQFGKDISGKYRAGNVILTEIQSYDIISAVYNAPTVALIRNYTFGGGFIVLCIFSCVLGIFWYKTQCRQAEIALHKIVGASSAHVCKRLLSEGVIILTVATIPAIVVDYMIGRWELTEVFNGQYITPLRFAATVGITYLLMLVMIVVGIGIPAWRAMQIEPAEALHEE